MEARLKRTASEEMAAKATGIDLHPAALLPDPPHCEWARDKLPNSPDRYGAELAATLEKAGERLVDPAGVSRSTIPEKPATKRPKRYRAGSTHLDVDSALGNSAIDALWSGAGAPDRTVRVGIVKSVLDAVKPRNELEGLVATQLIAAHAATMECYRRAMIPEQTFVGRSENFNQAAKASRTFAVLLEALDRHRGKGPRQRVEVRHVHVHAGGQAIVGTVGRGGARTGNSRQPHDQQAAITHAPGAPLPCQDAGRDAVSVACDAERQVPQTRRREPRRSNG